MPRGKVRFSLELMHLVCKLDIKMEKRKEGALDALKVSIIAYAKMQVLSDVEAGTVPEDVANFGDLHDHVDANYYGGAFEMETLPSEVGDDEEYVNAHNEFWNEVQGGVDAWIKDGGIRRKRLALTSASTLPDAAYLAPEAIPPVRPIPVNEGRPRRK